MAGGAADSVPSGGPDFPRLPELPRWGRASGLWWLVEPVQTRMSVPRGATLDSPKIGLRILFVEPLEDF